MQVSNLYIIIYIILCMALFYINIPIQIILTLKWRQGIPLSARILWSWWISKTQAMYVKFVVTVFTHCDYNYARSIIRCSVNH